MPPYYPSKDIPVMLVAGLPRAGGMGAADRKIITPSSPAEWVLAQKIQVGDGAAVGMPYRLVAPANYERLSAELALKPACGGRL